MRTHYLSLAAGLCLCAGVHAYPVSEISVSPATIGDPGSVSRTVTFATNRTVTSVRIEFNGLHHTQVGDLIMTITHDGRSMNFLDRPGVPPTAASNTGDFVATNNYIWTDSGNVFPEVAPSNGVIAGGEYKPAQQNGGFGPQTMANFFAGRTAFGDWTITVEDIAAGNSGGWNGFTIVLNTVPLPTAAGLGLAGVALVGLRRRR